MPPAQDESRCTCGAVGVFHKPDCPVVSKPKRVGVPSREEYDALVSLVDERNRMLIATADAIDVLTKRLERIERYCKIPVKWHG